MSDMSWNWKWKKIRQKISRWFVNLKVSRWQFPSLQPFHHYWLVSHPVNLFHSPGHFTINFVNDISLWCVQLWKLWKIFPPDHLLLTLAQNDKHVLLRLHVARQPLAQQTQSLPEKPLQSKQAPDKKSDHLAPAWSWSRSAGITLVLCSRTMLLVLLNWLWYLQAIRYIFSQLVFRFTYLLLQSPWVRLFISVTIFIFRISFRESVPSASALS